MEMGGPRHCDKNLPKRLELMRRSVINITTNPQLDVKSFIAEGKHGTDVSVFGVWT